MYEFMLCPSGNDRSTIFCISLWLSADFSLDMRGEVCNQLNGEISKGPIIAGKNEVI